MHQAQARQQKPLILNQPVEGYHRLRAEII
jgi:hypothetical protein